MANAIERSNGKGYGKCHSKRYGSAHDGPDAPTQPNPSTCGSAHISTPVSACFLAVVHQISSTPVSNARAAS